MTAEEAARPGAGRVRVADCAHKARALARRKDMAARDYADLRHRGRPAEIGRARLQRGGVGLGHSRCRGGG